MKLGEGCFLLSSAFTTGGDGSERRWGEIFFIHKLRASIIYYNPIHPP